MTEASKKDDNVALTKILYIYYLLYFCKNEKNMLHNILINFNTEVNNITYVYILKLGFGLYCTNVYLKKLMNLFSKYLKMF